VPNAAVVLGGPRPAVLVFDAASASARSVPVRFGVAQDDLIEVEGELTAGDRVVVRGNERLRPGEKLLPMEPR